MIADFLAQYGYYSFLAVGAASMVVLTMWRRRYYTLSAFSAVCFSLLLLVCGILGAKLLYFVESGFRSLDGMSFFGSVLLVLTLMPLVGLLFQLKPLQTLDVCAPCVASIISFMRFGCLCAGCCGGVLCTIGSYSFRWPTQLMEGLGDIMILALLLFLERSKNNKGLLYPVFLITYGIMRFIIEFLRETPKTLMGFSEGQWFATVVILIGTIWIIWFRKSKVNYESGT